MNIYLKIGLILMLLLVTFGGIAWAEQQPQQAPPLSIEKVKGNIYVVSGGSGANAGFFIGDKEVFLIDVKMSPESSRQMLDDIKKLTSLPVTTIILTHSDGDHVNGFPGVTKGLTIIAQEQCLKELEKAAEEQPFLKDYLPNQTFASDRTLKSGDDVIDLRNYGPAHTGGDAVVYLPGESVAFVGDLAFIGRDPLIHRRKNGNSLGLAKTLKAILDHKPKIETFVPGHGGLLTRTDIEGLIKSIEEKQSQIKAMVAEGRTLDEVKKAFGVADPPGGGMRFPSLAEVIYRELTEDK
jgi:glyoxylase-like metal-dependent hydrolase (beta-lactamase superfamily II)